MINYNYHRFSIPAFYCEKYVFKSPRAYAIKYFIPRDKKDIE